MSDVIGVALSGGVDSSTAAALLVDKGAAVFGVTMRLFGAHPGESRGSRLPSAARSGRCCGGSDSDAARAASAHLGIPFYLLDFEDDFRRLVVEDFVTGYREGRTPIPCARCNRDLKFERLLARVLGLGATTLATGHYARLRRDSATGRLTLARASDRGKDQTYFLFGLTQEMLSRSLFPLGDLTKAEVRDIARRHRLPNADKPESQDVCFVPGGDYRGFVTACAGPEEGGEVVDTSGRRLGRHDGVSRFTVGQRRGLGLAGPRPAYVVALEPAGRRVVVGSREESRSRSLETSRVNWVSRAAPARALDLAIQVRHRQPPVAGRVEPMAQGRARVLLSTPLAAAPGQAAVFYDGDLVAGGGWIETTERSAEVTPATRRAEPCAAPAG